MDYFPVFLDIKNKPCLVVGAGNIAARKIESLAKAGASVKVIALEICSAVQSLAVEFKIEFEQRDFIDTDIDGMFLVISATDNSSLNKRISEIAQAKQIPVNVVDDTDLCSFITPSTIERNPIQIAISTGGSSPVLARHIRTKLESIIPSSYGDLAGLFARYRDAVQDAFPHVDERKRFWESVLESPIAENVFSGRMDRANEALEALISRSNSTPEFKGEVNLVGAGPGDPDLLTFKALRLMQKCDVVVYDRLVSKPILELVRRDAEKLYAGKESANHSLSQENINQLLIRLAKQGKSVLRLKGGDPFIFGRGGEEISELINENINFQIVPGITAASGCATYAGIPLTHRDYSQACIFVTGHRKNNNEELNWKMLSHANQTVVFYMGLDNIQRICNSLKAHGRDESTPAALIEKGTTTEQRVLIGDLNSLPDIVDQNEVRAPTLIIVGEVVELHHKLSWYKQGEEIVDE